MNVFQITEDMKRIEWMIEASEGELTDEIQAEIDKIKNEVINQPDFFGGWLKNLKDLEANLKEANKGLSVKRKARENLYDRVQNVVIGAMKLVGYDKIRGKQFSLTLVSRAYEKIVWVGKGDPPKQYMKIVTTEELDMDKLKELRDSDKGLPKGFAVEAKLSEWIKVY